ncbi:hypothetical protein FB554_2249 [Barrientosiimonas humi]|uniref:Oligosaccharide repeat unit polymerase n=2 Tax=Barrientosiimonas humi TaxID=999931 RepID=A0A542XE36_9MICO|nr:hypothetical protein FB554_2249 [Barrientosiimonas humi]CAG7574081.1 hypothetical protein BH39T_PBIAJDOK_02724 [Barrientosiimonas humi]
MRTQEKDSPGRSGRLRFLSALICLALAWVLQKVYRDIVYPQFNYLGYSYQDPQLAPYALALAIVCLCAMLLPVKLRRPSDTIVWILFVVAGLPAILVPHYGGPLEASQAAMLSAQSGAVMLAITVAARRNPLSLTLPRISLPVGVFWTGVAVYSLGVYTLIFAQFGVPTSVPNLLDVYDVRGDYRTALEGAAILSYLIPTQAGVVNPIVIARGLQRGKTALILLGLTGQIVIFAASGLKSVILSTPALILFYAILRRDRFSYGWLIALGTFIGALGSMVADLARGTATWTSISVRRFLLTPGLLAAAYVYVFDEAEKGYWAYSFLSSFRTYPYTESPPFMVGRIYFGREGMNSNASLFADGFANLGFLGMAIEGGALIVLLWLVNASTQGLPNALATLTFVVPAIALANSSVFTTALTHGLIAGILLSMLMAREDRGRERDDARGAAPPLLTR